MVGFDDTDQLAGFVDDGQGAEIVFIEQLRDFVFVLVGADRNPTWFGEDLHPGFGAREHQAREGNDPLENLAGVDEINFGDRFRVTFESTQRADAEYRLFAIYSHGHHSGR